MRSPARFLTLTLALALAVSGCNRDSGGETTTSIGDITTTSLAPVETTTTAEPSTTATTSSSTTVAVTPGTIAEPEWSIAERVEGDDGATVVVLLDPESYERLTDIDLQNIVEDALEMFPPILEVHVVDSEEAADVVLSDVIDTDDQAILADHYLARLEEGFRLVFLGPFADFGITILGS